jgi:hypothetical protein
LRGEQKDISKADTAAAAAPSASESRDIPVEPETRSVDASREVEGPAADEANETPIESRAEYDHPREASNNPVSDTSAESNVIENQEPTIEAERPPYSAGGIEESGASEPKDLGVQSGTEVEHALAEHDIMETAAVSIPSESKSDVAEVTHPESQEPTPEIHDHEAQVGDESDYLKAEDELSNLEVHASDEAAVPEHLASVEPENSHHGLEKEGAETVPASLEEPTATEAQAINSVAEDKPPENAGAVNEESNVLNPEAPSTEPASDVEASPATKAREVEEHVEEGGHVTDDDQIPHSSDPTPTKDENPDVFRKENSEDIADGSVQGQEEEWPNLDHPVEHVSGESTQTDKPAEDGATSASSKDALAAAEEHITKQAASLAIEAGPVLEEKSMLEEEASSPAGQLYQEVTKDQPELKESEYAEVLEKEPSVPEEEHSMAEQVPNDPRLPATAVAWWERNGQVETPAKEALDESSWLSRSLPGVEQSSAEEHVPVQPPSAEAVEEHAEESGKQALNDQDEHVKHEDHSQTEEREISEAISPAISEEYGNEISHLSDIEEENEAREQSAAAEEMTPKGEEENPDPISLEPFPEGQLDTNDDHSSSETHPYPV